MIFHNSGYIIPEYLWARVCEHMDATHLQKICIGLWCDGLHQRLASRRERLPSAGYLIDGIRNRKRCMCSHLNLKAQSKYSNLVTTLADSIGINDWKPAARCSMRNRQISRKRRRAVQTRFKRSYTQETNNRLLWHSLIAVISEFRMFFPLILRQHTLANEKTCETNRKKVAMTRERMIS